MTVNFIVRLAQLQDLSTLVNFNQALAQEVRGKILDPQILTKGVKAVLSDSSLGFYILVEQDDKVIGSALINFEWSDWNNAWYWWLLDIYTDPNYRRKSAFRSLYKYLLTKAKASNVRGIRLYVYEGDTSAQEVFKKLGMVSSDSIIFESEKFY